MPKLLDSYRSDKELWSTSLSPQVLKLQDSFVENLTKEQRANIKELRDATEDVLEAHHNDYLLYKWLKARKFQVRDAEKMLRNNLKWRKEMKMDTIFDEGSDSYNPPEALDIYFPMGQYGHDKEGSNTWYAFLGNADVKGIVHSNSINDFIKWFSVFLELMQNLNKKQCESQGKLVSSQTVIIDASNVKLRDYIMRPALEAITNSLKILEANYPESLKKVFIVNAARIFYVVYSMMKPFLSEDTKNKVVIYGQDGWKEELLKIIDADQIPVHFGGTAVDEVDGNPYCSSKIGMGGVIPETYYLTQGKKLAGNDKLQSETVGKNSVHKIELKVDKPGSTIVWSFETEDYDIGFGISFKPDNNKNTEKNYILPVTRVNCNIVPEEGSLLCDKSGIYTVIFDNRYSWYKSKKLFYDLHISSPDDLAA